MATKSIAWNDGSGDYITLTYTGQGNGTVAVTSQPNNSANARSATFDIRTAAGSPVVTRELTVTQGACPFPVGDVKNFSYTGSYQEVELPAGQYKLQCWGAQGGSNAAASSYDITAKAGGKGGYSEGIITLSTKTTVRIYVGGQGSSSAGGFNGGGSTSGSASYTTGTSGQAGYVYGTSRMGGGGGATDIRLSDGALLSRMIVAGGGSGGAMTYRKETTSTTSWQSFFSTSGSYSNDWSNFAVATGGTAYFSDTSATYRVKFVSSNASETGSVLLQFRDKLEGFSISTDKYCTNNSWVTFTVPSGCTLARTLLYTKAGVQGHAPTFTCTIEKQVTTTSTNSYTDSKVGFAGGGTTGVGYSSTYQGKQNGAGSGGSFGQGANQTITNYRHCSGAGGGGWYGGGGGSYSDSSTTYCKYSGGGSGWVNIAANASYRPSGYTGLELDSGETKAGNVSFPSTSGGTETGHSGNGYARITRLA